MDSGDLSPGSKSKAEKGFSCPSTKLIDLILPNLAQMEIQHIRNLINAQFCQYPHHVSNVHAQHKIVWEG